MGIERKKYVMPVELAMRREMTYREKLQSCGAGSCNTDTPSSSKNPPLSSQRPCAYFGPGPGSGLGQVPQPMVTTSMPLARPPHWRPNPPSGPTHSADDRHRKMKDPLLSHQRDFFCHICQVDCTSEINMWSHLNGQKHKAKLEDDKGMKMANGGRIEAKKMKNTLYCEICGIFCSNHFSLWQHFLGKNHILKMLASEMKMKGSGSGSGSNGGTAMA